MSLNYNDIPAPNDKTPQPQTLKVSPSQAKDYYAPANRSDTDNEKGRAVKLTAARRVGKWKVGGPNGAQAK
jgi:hypothetical protein